MHPLVANFGQCSYQRLYCSPSLNGNQTVRLATEAILAKRIETKAGGFPCGLNIVHLFLVSALVEELLEVDGLGGLVNGGLKFFPRGAQFRRALGVAERR